MEKVKKVLDRIFIEGLSAMAHGLFATLIIGTIIQQIGTFMGGNIGEMIFIAGKLAAALTGAGIGVAVAYKFKEAPLVVVSAATAGMAGAATVGCCCNMVGFAVASYRENKVGGLLAQGIGTSMLQVPNIVKKPVIWLPAIISSAILGPVGTLVLHMTNNATGSGMGTAGLVGQIMTWQTMIQTESAQMVLIKILLIQIVLPAVVTLGVSEFMRKKDWIKMGDMKLEF